MTPEMSDVEPGTGSDEVRKTATIDIKLHSRTVHIAVLQGTRLPGAGTIRKKTTQFSGLECCTTSTDFMELFLQLKTALCLVY